MSALAIAALVLVCLWLGVLTLVVVLLRQIGFDRPPLRIQPDAAARRRRPGGRQRRTGVCASVLLDLEERAYLVLISSTCTPCWELVADLGEYRFEQKIVPSCRAEEHARELAALLPSSIRVVLDPEASRLAESLELESTPFALEVQRGTVTRKAYAARGRLRPYRVRGICGRRKGNEGFRRESRRGRDRRR